MNARTLEFAIFRYDPRLPDKPARTQHYRLPEQPGMTIFSALKLLQAQQDSSLRFDFVCRAGVCGSCAMVINGVPTLACKTLTTSSHTGHFTLMPLPGFELIADLAVDTGRFMRSLSARLEAWLQPLERAYSIDAVEQPMDPQAAALVYDADRCIECGCCIAACASAQMRSTFIGAVGLNKIARFALDERDCRGPEDFYHILASADGIFGCMTLLGCADTCPKQLPHQMQIGYLRRKLVLHPERIATRTV